MLYIPLQHSLSTHHTTLDRPVYDGVVTGFGDAENWVALPSNAAVCVVHLWPLHFETCPDLCSKLEMATIPIIAMTVQGCAVIIILVTRLSHCDTLAVDCTCGRSGNVSLWYLSCLLFH
jgi:hypothetical protein